MNNDKMFDSVIVGGGHNGLIASCYLASAGLRVLILEKNNHLGGATWSNYTFPGVDVRVSEYSYLISLLPKKILSDLNINLEIRKRSIASFTPLLNKGSTTGILVSNTSEDTTRNSFIKFTGDEREYQKYRILQEKLVIFARNVWPTLLSPIPSKKELHDKFQQKEEREIWEYLVEKPLSALIEDHLTDDLVRGIVFTDAKIGHLTNPDDPTLLQNKTFLYHIIGQGTGEWSVPVGGMGALVDALKKKAQTLGVSFETSAKVVKVDHGVPNSVVRYEKDEKEMSVAATSVLFNTASNIVNQCLPHAYVEEQVEGSVFKINMVLKKLPGLKGDSILSKDAFTGTFHLNESYEHMKTSYRNAKNGTKMDTLPGEMYCHSLTDPSILSTELQEKGYQTLTLFGLDVPYHWFTQDNAAMKDEITQNYLRSINQYIDEDILECLARDADGNLCLEAKSPVDLENSIGLPKGNIFHGNLTWPFAEVDDDVSTWGVETNYDNVLICGSSAKRGGAVSGIPGHNAAMKVLETMGRKLQ